MQPFILSALLNRLLLRWRGHLSQHVDLLVEDDQHRLNRDVGLVVVEVGTNVIISHLFCQSNCRLDVTSTLRQIRNEILDHEANVAVCRDATVGSLALSQFLMKLLDQHTRVLLHEDLLNQDQAFFEHGVMLAYAGRVLKRLEQL